jgi:hypothetical protein
MHMSSRNVQCQICAFILCRTPPPTQVSYVSDPVSSTRERLWSSHQMRILPSMHQNIHIRWWWWLKGVSIQSYKDSLRFVYHIQGKERHPYPVGYKATRRHGGHNYSMEIGKGMQGPLFSVCRNLLTLLCWPPFLYTLYMSTFCFAFYLYACQL